jgi:hypothetical protein
MNLVPGLTIPRPHVIEKGVCILSRAEKDAIASKEDETLPDTVISKRRKSSRGRTSFLKAMPLLPVPGPQVRENLVFIGAPEEHHDRPVVIVRHRVSIPDRK